MRNRLALVSLAGILAACVAGQESSCFLDRQGPTPIPSPTPTPSPSPTPSASPTPTPEDCRIDYMTLRPTDGLTLAKDEQGRVSLTPYQTIRNPDGSVAQREVSEACNLPRVASIVWRSSSASVEIGSGFEPIVKRVGVGVASITATLEGKVSNPVTVR